MWWVIGWLITLPPLYLNTQIHTHSSFSSFSFTQTTTLFLNSGHLQVFQRKVFKSIGQEKHKYNYYWVNVPTWVVLFGKYFGLNHCKEELLSSLSSSHIFSFSFSNHHHKLVSTLTHLQFHVKVIQENEIWHEFLFIN